MKPTYNKSEIFKKAYAIAKNELVTFREALSTAWREAKIKAIYELNQVIRICRDAVKVKAATEAKSRIIVEPIVVRTKYVYTEQESRAIELFYSK